jgi:hypothetical protein
MEPCSNQSEEAQELQAEPQCLTRMRMIELISHWVVVKKHLTSSLFHVLQEDCMSDAQKV